MIKTYSVNIKGKTPLILHNGAGAAPNDPRVLPDFLQKKFSAKTFGEAGKLSTKRNKTDADHEKLAELGFYSSLYLDDKGRIILPSVNLEKMIHDQSKELKLGRIFQRGLMVPENAVLDFPNKKKKLKDLFELHRYDCLVKVSQSTTPRTRAIFPEWSCVFTVELVAKVVDLSTLKEVMDLGEIYGSFERRPRHGRYKVVSIR